MGNAKVVLSVCLVVVLGWGSLDGGMRCIPRVSVVMADEGQGQAERALQSQGPAEAAATVEKRLDQRIDVDYKDVPLQDVLSALATETGLQFYLANKPLEEAGLPRDMPVTCQLRNVRLRTLLDVLLDELDLTYSVKDDLVVITTPAHAESRMIVQVYDCRDLLAMAPPPNADKMLCGPACGAGCKCCSEGTAAPAEGKNVFGTCGLRSYGPRTVHEASVQQLIDVITRNVAPDSWDMGGGPGVITEFNGLFVVRQTSRNHAELAEVLETLRRVAKLASSQQPLPQRDK